MAALVQRDSPSEGPLRPEGARGFCCKSVFPSPHCHAGACGLLVARGGMQQGCRGARPGRWSAKEFTGRPVFSQVRGKDQNRLPDDRTDRCSHVARFWEGQWGRMRVGPVAETLLFVRGG